MRASVMLHLPGLRADERDRPDRQGHAARSAWPCAGCWGEGTEALGNMFQISNQMTLGGGVHRQSPEQIVLEIVSTRRTRGPG